MCAPVFQEIAPEEQRCVVTGQQGTVYVSLEGKCNASQPSDCLLGIPAGPHLALSELESSSFQIKHNLRH